MRLVVRSNPEPEESLHGYLWRLAAMNGHESPPFVQRKDPRNRAICTLDFAALLSLPEGALNGRLYKASPGHGRGTLRGAPISNWQLSLYWPKLCPECLAEKQVARAEWDLKLWVTCPKHELQLIDKCPKCSERVRWSRPSLCHCKGCGFDFRMAPRMTPLRPLITLASLIEISIHHGPARHLPSIDTAFVELEPVPLLQFCRLFGHHRSGPMATNLAPAEIALRAAKVIEGWPLTLYARFDRILASENYSHAAVRRCNKFVRIVKGQGLDFVQRAYTQYKLIRGANPQNSFLLPYKTIDRNPAAQYISTEGFSRVTGISIGAVRQYIASNFIPTTWLKDAGGATISMIALDWLRDETNWHSWAVSHPTKVHRAKNARPCSLRFGELTLVGALRLISDTYSEAMIEDLCALKLICRRSLKYSVGSRLITRWAYSAQSISNLLARLSAVSSPLDTDHSNLVSLVRNRHCKAGTPSPGDLIQKVLNGELTLKLAWPARYGLAQYCVGRPHQH